jgi:hypothetical protein
MADNNQIIGATIQVDTGNSGANVASLNKETSQLKSTLGQVGATVKGTGKEVGLSGEHFGKLKGQIAALPGPTNQLTQGLGGVNQAFNLLRANPIIGIFALIAGLVIALFQKFQKMEAVSDSLGKAWGVLGTIFNFFLNKILTPLIDAFTTLIDLFTSAATWIVGIFSPGMAEAAKRGGELADALDDLNDAEAKSAITRAESNRRLQEAREIAEDANIPIQERIKALKEAARIEKEETEKSIQIATERAKIMLEQIALELDARDGLIQSIRNGSIEQLKAARDEIFAMKNVDKEKLKAIDDLIIQSENQGASLAKINKKTQVTITSLEKEEEGKRKEARDKAIADQKQAEQKLYEFRTKLRQLQQDNEIAQIKDGYAKELRQLEIKLQNDKEANERAVRQGNLTRQQANLLAVELQKQYDLKIADATEKHNKEVLQKETDFQTKLAKLKQDIMLGGIVNQRDLEREQLKISREEAIKDAEKQYAEDAEKLNQIKLLINEKFRQDQKKQEEAFAEEDRKAALDKAQKELEGNLKKEDKVIDDPESQLELKKIALDAEQKLIEDAFNNKILTEVAYTDYVSQLAEKRKKIAELETEHKKQQATETANVLNNLATIVGKQTVAGKALGIATALINTYQGASDALRAKSVLPSPFDVVAKIVNVGAVIAAGVKTVKAITAVQVPGGAGGVSTPSVSTPAAPIAPTQTSTKLDADSINNIGNAAAGGVNRNIRAYVVGSDVQNESEREARLRRAATLGGG